jgi:hypothetical protein
MAETEPHVTRFLDNGIPPASDSADAAPDSHHTRGESGAYAG